MKNDKWLEAQYTDKKKLHNNVKYYYLYHEKPSGRQPYACVCIIRNVEVFARGISICNEHEDQFVKKIGRKIAEGRAIKALKDEASKEPINPMMKRHLQLPADFMFMSDWMREEEAKLTNMEHDLFEKRK